ncbi:MAG: TrmJ/YjtD family RNA methyltransferase [Crenarchaeota archaeon]|nr:TrmJ/YjtD family RNA methyltransferase [Thermoproteota archaeon]
MRIRVVLVGVEGPVNLGFIARTCVNFGVDELFLVNPKADLEEALIYSAKAKDFLRKAMIVDDLGKAIHDVDLSVATTAKGYSRGDALRQSIDLVSFTEILREQPVDRLALVFGRESTGLTREELKRADYLVTIPANPEYPVLNLSQSVAVFLWELWKIRGMQASNVPPQASREELELLQRIINDITARVIGDEEKRHRVYMVVTRLLMRARPTRYDARMLTYWFRRILNKISTRE